MTTAWQHTAASLHQTTFFWDVQPLAVPSFEFFLCFFLSPCGAVSDISRGRHFERHHEPAAHPASTRYRNRSYDQSWTLPPKSTNAAATLLISTWNNGSEAKLPPEYVPVSPPNDPRHLPPPSQFVSLALATVHPRLANPSIGRINNRFIHLAAALPPSRRVTNEPFPFGPAFRFIGRLLPVYGRHIPFLELSRL